MKTNNQSAGSQTAAKRRSDAEAAPKLITHSAQEVQAANYPPLICAVKDILPQGLCILAGPSKICKSWMVLDLCLSVAAGKPFLDRETYQMDCLYVSLEDGYRRIQDRMNKLLAGEPAPPGLDYAIKCAKMADGLFEHLGDYMASHPKTGLIVIDPLQCVRDKNSGFENAYAVDYRDMSQFKAFADQWKITLLVVHHSNKKTDNDDPMNENGGTRAMTAAPDTDIQLRKPRRFSDEAIMCLTGRDVESFSDILRFDKATCKWIRLGTEDEILEQREQQSYEKDPLVVTIRVLMEENPDGWIGNVGRLMDLGREITGAEIAESPRGAATRLKILEDQLLKYDHIVHKRKPNGTGGGQHILQRERIPSTEQQSKDSISERTAVEENTMEGEHHDPNPNH